MFFILSKLLTLFLMPFFWLFSCIFYSFLTKNVRKKRLFLKISIFILFVFGNTNLVSKVMRWWEPSPIEYKNLPFHNIAIVLGGGIASEFQRPFDRVHFDPSVDRLLQALQLYQAKKVGKIMISGGSAQLTNSKNKKSDATESFKFLIKVGVPKTDIIVENESRNTYENAKFSKEKLIELKLNNASLLLITSAYHMNRSLACFNKQGLKISSFPACYQQTTNGLFSFNTIVPDETAFTLWYDLFHEWYGIFFYKIMGYI